MNKTSEYKNENFARPFLKWAGGKGQLLREIEKYYIFDENITRYAEPFVGGGAVLFNLLNKFSLKEIYISDINEELINTYIAIRDNVEELITLLADMQSRYLLSDESQKKEYFYENRDRFNSLKSDNSGNDNPEKAALMIFLNKTCFNGLYRVNSKGFYNVPAGKYKNPVICDEANLRAVSEKLKPVEIVCADYHESAAFIDEHTFVYIDPPYRPLTETASFTSYNSEMFNDENQIELAEFVAEMDRKGAKIVVSNSDPKNINPKDDFFENIYSAFNIKRVKAARMINSKGDSRGKITELLISNFTESRPVMTKRNFNEWLSKFHNSIADYGYYINFKKVFDNVDTVRVELNILNSLIGSKNIKEDFKTITTKYPETLKCIPLLLAIRADEIYCQDENGGVTYSFKSEDIQNAESEKYVYFMEKTGLFDLLENHIINNLVDYATGVETGLDSNGRKNRGGHLMENLVESYLKKAGFIKGKNYFSEMYIHEITEKWGIDLSVISNQGKTEKRFDFVVKTADMIYAIEVNFYGGGGSKLNETARSYKTLALETQSVDGFTFVWFTDGKGWISARHNLEETFDIMEHVYNISDLEDGIISRVIK